VCFDVLGYCVGIASWFDVQRVWRNCRCHIFGFLRRKVDIVRQFYSLRGSRFGRFASLQDTRRHSCKRARNKTRVAARDSSDTESIRDKHGEAKQRGVRGRVWREGEANHGRVCLWQVNSGCWRQGAKAFFRSLKQRPAHLCHRFKNTNSTPHRQTTTLDNLDSQVRIWYLASAPFPHSYTARSRGSHRPSPTLRLTTRLRSAVVVVSPPPNHG
jgi:hypothetical protein